MQKAEGLSHHRGFQNHSYHTTLKKKKIFLHLSLKSATCCFVLFFFCQCCGRPLSLSSMQMEGLAVLNIPSMHGGSNLWGESKKLDSVPKVESSEVITDPELLKTISQGKRRLRFRGGFFLFVKPSLHSQTSNLSGPDKRVLPIPQTSAISSWRW